MTNLLPATYLLERKCRKKKNQIKLGAVFWVVLLSAIILGETAGIAYNTAIGTTSDISGQAKNEQTLLVKENEALKKSITLINRAYSEDKEIVKVADVLATIKPDDIKLTKLEIFNGIVSIEGYSANPSAFNNYVEKLKINKDLFLDAKLENISSPTPAYKTGVIKATLLDAN